jgi:hypothetical protein
VRETGGQAMAAEQVGEGQRTHGGHEVLPLVARRTEQKGEVSVECA